MAKQQSTGQTPRKQSSGESSSSRSKPKAGEDSRTVNRIGFSRQDLTTFGALSPLESYIFGFQPLRNPIHPLFTYESFDPTSFTPEDYASLRPCLQLASQYITNKAALEWWVTLVLGGVEQIRCHPGHSVRPALTFVGPSPKRQQQTYDALMDLGGKIHWSWNCNVESVWATTLHMPRPDGRVITTALSPRLLTAVKTVRERNDPVVAMRFWFFLAAILVQEVAHAVGRIVKMQLVDGSIAPGVKRIAALNFEPFVNAIEPNNDLGESWSYAMFGGILEPINDMAPGTPTPAQHPDPSLLQTVTGDGLAWVKWLSSEHRLRAQLHRKPGCRAVTMNGIINWFRHEMWERVARHDLFELPLELTSVEAEFPATTDSWFIGTRMRKRHFTCSPPVGPEEKEGEEEEEYDDAGRTTIAVEEESTISHSER